MFGKTKAIIKEIDSLSHAFTRGKHTLAQHKLRLTKLEKRMFRPQEGENDDYPFLHLPRIYQELSLEEQNEHLLKQLNELEKHFWMLMDHLGLDFVFAPEQYEICERSSKE